jgi:hypothetical protein
MDDCTQYLELISARLDGELSVEEENRLQAHLAQCPDCRALLADLTAIHLETSQPTGDAPNGFSQRVMQRIQADVLANTERKKRHHRWQIIGGMAAALALVIWAVTPVGPMSLLSGSGNTPSAAMTKAADTAQAASYDIDTQSTADESASTGEQESSSIPSEPQVSDGDVLDSEQQEETSDPSDPDGEANDGAPQDTDSPEQDDPSTPSDSSGDGAAVTEEPENTDKRTDVAFTLMGQVPPMLVDYPSYAWEDGSHAIRVPAEDFFALEDSLYSLGMTGDQEVGNADAVWIHVIPVSE